MILSIPDGQLCEAFDPMMILPEKTNYIINDPLKASTSCVAPAFVYLEGSRGKRFLCDYHYHYEKDITLARTPKLWEGVCQKIIDNRNLISNTFPTNYIDGIENIMKKCWCGTDSFVMATRHDNGDSTFFCNFHYRKLFYRYLSNGRQITDDYDILDGRINMKISVVEEVEKLTLI